MDSPNRCSASSVESAEPSVVYASLTPIANTGPAGSRFCRLRLDKRRDGIRQRNERGKGKPMTQEGPSGGFWVQIWPHSAFQMAGMFSGKEGSLKYVCSEMLEPHTCGQYTSLLAHFSCTGFSRQDDRSPTTKSISAYCERLSSRIHTLNWATHSEYFATGPTSCTWVLQNNCGNCMSLTAKAIARHTGGISVLDGI